MKISKRIKSVPVGLMSFVLPSLVFAANPYPWELFNNDGTVNQSKFATDGKFQNITCPTGATCSSSPLSDVGIYQDNVTDDATGKTYIRTLIGDHTSTAGGNSEVFANESYVTTGANSGISTRQIIDSNQSFDNVNGGTLKSDAIINTGAFLNANENSVVLRQQVGDNLVVPVGGTQPTRQSFNSDFDYMSQNNNGTITAQMSLSQANNPEDGLYKDSFNFIQTTTQAPNATSVTITGTKLDITANIALNNIAAGTTPNLNDQTFVYRMREGSYTPNAGSAAISGATGNVAWVEGDKVALWLIGQSVTGVGGFGYTSIDNLSNSAAPLKSFNFDAPTDPVYTPVASNPFN